MFMCVWLSFQQLKKYFKLLHASFSALQKWEEMLEIQLNEYRKHLPSSMLNLRSLHAINKWCFLLFITIIISHGAAMLRLKMRQVELLFLHAEWELRSTRNCHQAFVLLGNLFAFHFRWGVCPLEFCLLTLVYTGQLVSPRGGWGTVDRQRQVCWLPMCWDSGDPEQPAPSHCVPCRYGHIWPSTDWLRASSSLFWKSCKIHQFFKKM